jgi:serine/threonine protein kinase
MIIIFSKEGNFKQKWELSFALIEAMLSIIMTTTALNVFLTLMQEFTNKYTFNEVIGRGCYSKVKLAYDNISHKKVAVKILDKADVLKNNIYTDVRREKDILLQIQLDPRNASPFIIPLI